VTENSPANPDADANDIPPATAVASVASVEPAKTNKPRKHYSLAISFVALAAMSIALCFLNGILPIYAIEAAMWGGLAGYAFKKSPLSAFASLIVLLLAVVVAGLEGFTIGQHFGSESYTYLSQSNAQYRVNRRSGRTDRLTNSGWKPVSFDRRAMKIPDEETGYDIFAAMTHYDPLFKDGGTWENGHGGSAGKICFNIQNDTDYVLSEIRISVEISKKNTAEADKFSDIRLSNDYGGLLDSGDAAKFCGTAPRNLSDGETWSFHRGMVTGWKR
jgi:hypothetical protein